MLFGYELKKIWRRISPILVVVVLASTALVTMLVSFIAFHYTPSTTADVSTQYAELATKITDWDAELTHDEFIEKFDKFYYDYRVMNAMTHDGGKPLVDSYQKAQKSFNGFYLDYYCKFFKDENQNQITDYLLIKTKYFELLDKILDTLNDFFLPNYDNPGNIVNGLRRANPSLEDASLQDILYDLFYPQSIDPEELADLQAFFTEHPAGEDGVDYTDAYEYAQNRFWLAVDNAKADGVGELSQYAGFTDYQGVTAATRACDLAAYRLEHADNDFTTPFAFGEIYDTTGQVSLFHFVFTNMEMAMIPVVLMVIIWSACTFFTDHYQKTLVAPIAAGKRRATIILTKMAVILTLTAVTLLLLTGVYAIGGLLLFRAYIDPGLEILFLFNGSTIMTMSQFNYFALYFLNLIFKLLPLIAVCGLFSFTKTKPFVIVGFTALVCIGVVLCNALLGGFGFYQFIPLMGLDPMRYFGAKLLFAPMPNTYNLWYTFPVVLGLTAILYWALIRIFRHHDF